MVTQFKCYKCSSIVENIPYCGGCEIALPNCCKVNGYKCSDCNVSQYCAHGEVKSLDNDYFNKYCTVIKNGVRHYQTKQQRNRKKKSTFSKLNVVVKDFSEDGDLLNDFENQKAAQILSIVHSGINNKKRKYSIAERKRLKDRRAAVYERDENKCLKCGSSFDLTLDHILPKSRGGKNDFDNLQTLCGKCNREKDREIIDYRKVAVGCF